MRVERRLAAAPGGSFVNEGMKIVTASQLINRPQLRSVAGRKNLRLALKTEKGRNCDAISQMAASQRLIAGDVRDDDRGCHEIRLIPTSFDRRGVPRLARRRFDQNWAGAICRAKLDPAEFKTSYSPGAHQSSKIDPGLSATNIAASSAKRSFASEIRNDSFFNRRIAPAAGGGSRCSVDRSMRPKQDGNTITLDHPGCFDRNECG